MFNFDEENCTVSYTEKMIIEIVSENDKETLKAIERYCEENNIDPNLIEKEESKVVEKSFDKAKFYNDEGATYKHGDIVMHAIFGKGVVIDSDEKFVTVAFNKRFGIKKVLNNYQGLRRI